MVCKQDLEMQRRMALGLSVHLVLPVLALIVIPVSCQMDCPPFNESDLGNTDARSRTGLVVGAFQAVSGDPSPVNVQVHTSRIVCLVSGRTRDTYGGVSVVVNYTCTGAHSNCNGNPILSQFEFQCVAGPTWSATVGGSAANIITTPPSGNFSTTLRRDCGVCVSPMRSSFGTITNNEQHCGACNSACNFSLKKCFNRLDSGCCSVYENNMCTGNCTSPLVANSSSICVTDCGFLNITNGVVNYQPQGQDQTLMGATASYTCNSGYTLSGNGVRTCQASGVWTNSDPSCNPIDCGTLNAPLNGELSITSSTFGSVAVYSCMPPYVLSGTTARTCQSTGEWSGSEPVCSCSLFCHNGGTPDSSCMACHCTPGLTGILCDMDIDECDGINPCSGGSSCINELGGYRCECGPGFTGQNCAEDINECLSHPCLNGGTCANEIGGFNCSCINGYFGETCGDISPCFRNCSEACLQAQWERDLCVFYNELRDWRSTAVQCGLQVPNMEPSNQGTADQQWSEARAYWNTLRSLWAIQAQNRDVIDPALSQPTPGSGVLDVLWQNEATNWEAEFNAWQQYAISQGLPLEFATSPAVIQSNWMIFLNEWSSSYGLYNDTYSQVCRT